MGTKHVLSAAPLYASQAIAAIFPLLIAPIIIQKLGIDVFGVYASLVTASQVTLLVSEYSFDALGPRLLAVKAYTSSSSNRDVYLHVLLAKIPLIIAGTIIGCLVAAMILKRLPTTLEAISLGIMAAGSAANAPWYLISTDRVWLLAAVSTASKTLTIACTLGLVFLPTDNGSHLFLALAAPVFLSGIFIATRTLPKRVPTIESLRRSRKYLADGKFAFVGNAAAAAQNVLGVLLIGTFSGSANLGIYSAIDRIARTLSAAVKPLFQILYPAMAKLHATDKKMARRRLDRLLTLAFIIGSSLVAASFAAGHHVLAALFGPEIARHSLVLSLLIIWLGFGTANNLLGIQGLLASGHDILYSGGIWICIFTTVGIALLGIGELNYIVWVAGSVAAGEFFALCYYLAAYRRLI